MKGLLIKDFCLLRNQKRILPIFLLLAIFFSSMHDDGFAFSFLTMMATILAGSTISYDEIDHSQAYLFALPVDRKTYVREKFTLGGILTAASILLAVICNAVRLDGQPDMQGIDLRFMILLSVCEAIVLLSVMIPIRIRFGEDQGRIVLYVSFAVISLVAVLLTKAFPEALGQIKELVSRLGTENTALLAGGVSCILLITGYLLGAHWIESKEF